MPDISSSCKRLGWQVPDFDLIELAKRRTRYCVCIPIINEGQRILDQLTQMQRLEIHRLADILILDGGSTDGCTEPGRLGELGVRSLLIKRGNGKQGAQMRMGYAYALLEGYEGIVNIDGNGKDSVDSIPSFLRELEAGWDMIQGSRFIAGGQAVRTPWWRALAIKLIHVPLIRLASGFPYTDTTNAFRGYSRRLLMDPQVGPFREIFQTYELLAYLSARSPRLGFRTREIPVRREYPADGTVPTKISHFRGNLKLAEVLWKTLRGAYDPSRVK